MSLTVTTEIAAPPNVVREKFLDFQNISSYTKAFEYINAPRPGKELEKNDKVSVKIATSPAFPAVIQTNTPTHFSWTGSIPYIFTGTHSFHFTPSSTTPGGTTFTQQEVFSGALGNLLMGEGVLAKVAGWREKTRGAWEGFNGDLKEVCEGGL